MFRLSIISLLLTTISFLSMVFVIATSTITHPERASDPFVEYQALLPGQPFLIAQQPGCHLQTVVYTMRPFSYCRMTPSEGSFQSVIVTVQNGNVHEIWFQADGLVIGDLVNRWGWPQRITRLGSQFRLAWDGGLYATVEPENVNLYLSALLLIKHLTLTVESPLS